MGVRCFFVVPTERAQRSLRRFTFTDQGRCPGERGYHNACAPLDIVPRVLVLNEDERPNSHRHWQSLPEPKIALDDPRWPVKCEGCDYLFAPDDERQVADRQIYVDPASGIEYPQLGKVPGMMWDQFWAHEFDRGPDGLSLAVVCPNGAVWEIDGPCSNCTAKTDRGPYGVAHRCWNRSGAPPLISVGKGPGRSCAAGGGSIQAGSYHGFLGSNGAPPGFFT